MEGVEEAAEEGAEDEEGEEEEEEGCEEGEETGELDVLRQPLFSMFASLVARPTQRSHRKRRPRRKTEVGGGRGPPKQVYVEYMVDA